MKKSIKIGGQFSGVGAFDQALNRLGVNYENVYQAEWDKYARKTYLHNYEEPQFYVEDVHDTPIDDINKLHGPLDLVMFSPPCQAFSLAGIRKGENDERGILFYNSLEFIRVNKPRYFIFENVKGLLSDDGGKTFGKWVDYLGGKSVNGNPIIFPREDSVPYHIYYKVLNAKHYGVPQNRERIFIIGIRDDEDNTFRFPKEVPLTKKLKDVLEENVDEKYYLSEKMINGFIQHNKNHKEKGIGNTIKVKSATKKGYEIATDQDSINFSVPSSETRRGRVGKGVAQTLDTQCNQGTYNGGKIRKLTPRECFRLMDFPDTFDFSVVSDTQAYKQAGNSIVVAVLEKIIANLKL